MRPLLATILASSLVVGSFAIAQAAPGDRETTSRISYNDKSPRAAPDSWVQVASPTPASHGREYIEVDEDAGYVRLRIAAHAGRPIVRTVRLDFRNGKSRVVQIDRALDKGKPAFIDVDRSQTLERIVVVSEGPAKASYDVSAVTSIPVVATR